MGERILQKRYKILELVETSTHHVEHMRLDVKKELYNYVFKYSYDSIEEAESDLLKVFNQKLYINDDYIIVPFYTWGWKED